MGKKLFVGGLPWAMTDEDLGKLFVGAGTVESAIIIKDKMSGKSKGFGFVEMSTEEEMATAISTMNGKEIEGRNITVSEAKPMTDRPAGGNRF